MSQSLIRAISSRKNQLGFGFFSRFSNSRQFHSQWPITTPKCSTDSSLVLLPVLDGFPGQYKDEFVTAGGVPLSEISLKTMESRLVPNLFFAGEVLNVDGVTGGFNFQNAWSGGYIAGTHIGKLASHISSTERKVVGL
ncbi:hypothetical protein F2Q69_00016118 [Brassica cretica]|uniref:RsdA/BaiN/AoA(So)-like Rossmann fold-like domain-containing protein n=1 Tax=Brassica cretica TaxID=69181 RepID=A0A8S9QZX8_BRACR|nr:hypothetical protein F2Q69_00016118 [Brassica cretica]